MRLILMYAAHQMSALPVPFAGVLILIGRAMHSYTVALDGTPVIGRVIGMVMTMNALIFASTHLLCKALHALLQ